MELKPNQLRFDRAPPAGFVWHHAVAGGPGTKSTIARFSIRLHGEVIFSRLINGANETRLDGFLTQTSHEWQP